MPKRRFLEVAGTTVSDVMSSRVDVFGQKQLARIEVFSKHGDLSKYGEDVAPKLACCPQGELFDFCSCTNCFKHELDGAVYDRPLRVFVRKKVDGRTGIVCFAFRACRSCNKRYTLATDPEFLFHCEREFPRIKVHV